MTEAEWETCTFPARMLYHLQLLRGVTDRKLRLTACACLRLVWDRLPTATVRPAIEVAERFLDGAAGLAELTAARSRAAHDAAEMSRSAWFGDEEASRDVWYAVALDPVGRPLGDVIPHLTWVSSSFRSLFILRTRRRESRVLREILGNPFRPPAIDPAWRTEAVVALAAAIYADRAYHLLPIRVVVQ